MQVRLVSRLRVQSAEFSENQDLSLRRYPEESLWTRTRGDPDFSKSRLLSFDALSVQCTTVFDCALDSVQLNLSLSDNEQNTSVTSCQDADANKGTGRVTSCQLRLMQLLLRYLQFESKSPRVKGIAFRKWLT